MPVPIGLVIAIFGAWLFWVMLPLALSRWGFNVQMETLGQWGDTFGALNAAFSAAAVVGVLVTLRMQSREIADQRKQIDDQNERLERSEFEATFFQLLQLSRELRDKATFAVTGDLRTSIQGRASFEAADNLLQKVLLPDYAYPDMVKDFQKRIAEAYRDDVHRYAEHSFGPYFRILYTILRRISESGILRDDDKARFGNLVRSQLSSAELSLIAANALTEASNDLSDYVIEFRLLKYLPEGEYKNILRTIYPKEAFEARDEGGRQRKLGGRKLLSQPQHEKTKTRLR